MLYRGNARQWERRFWREDVLRVFTKDSVRWCWYFLPGPFYLVVLRPISLDSRSTRFVFLIYEMKKDIRSNLVNR